jgi:hypothetical protein
VSAYETRLVPEIKAAAKAARDAEVARVVREFEGDLALWWSDLLLGHAQPIIDEAKRICAAHGTYPRAKIGMDKKRHSGRR